MIYMPYNEPPHIERIIIIMTIVNKVQEYPHVALAAIGVLGVALAVQTVKLQLAELTSHQVMRAADDLGLAEQLIKQMAHHGPYYKGQ
jgi:hypothetical protein